MSKAALKTRVYKRLAVANVVFFGKGGAAYKAKLCFLKKSAASKKACSDALQALKTGKTRPLIFRLKN
jgi:hypothetical protein